jgi:hypothetical protein
VPAALLKEGVVELQEDATEVADALVLLASAVSSSRLLLRCAV